MAVETGGGPGGPDDLALRIDATPLPLDAIADAGIKCVYELWNRRRGTLAMPPRGALKPEDLAPALGKVNLLAVLRDPLRFVFRIRGSVIADLHNPDMTGRDVSRMEPPVYRDMLIRHYAEAVEKRAPTLYDIHQMRGPHNSSYRRLILPLGTPEGCVEMLLTVSAWEADFPRRTERLGFKHR
jgi:hypothetical protein